MTSEYEKTLSNAKRTIRIAKWAGILCYWIPLIYIGSRLGIDIGLALLALSFGVSVQVGMAQEKIKVREKGIDPKILGL